MPGIDHLWKIALRAKNTDVSLSAIQYINSYYINGEFSLGSSYLVQCIYCFDGSFILGLSYLGA